MLTLSLGRLATLPRDSRDTLFLLAVTAWVLLPQAGRLPLWCSLGAAAVLVWRGWMAVHARALPRKRWLALLLALTLAATYQSHGTLLGRDAGVTLLVVLITLKTLELRARRDAFVVFFLGFFCMLSNFFYSQSLLTAASMVVGLLGLLTALVNAHMPVGKPPLLQAAKTAGSMALLGAPVMLVLFMLFPRMAPLWGMPSDAMAGRSGLSASMEVGTIATLALDDSVALRLRFESEPPPQRDLYLRGPVLSSFDGRQWLPLRRSLPASYDVPVNLQVAGTPVAYEVTLQPTSRPWLFVLEAAVQSPELPGYRNRMQDDLQWMTSRPITDLVRYRAVSYPQFSHGPRQQMLGLQEFVDLPPGFNPRTLALAAEIRRDPRFAQAGASALVQVALERLRTGGYSYTLEPGIYGRDTADEFWFDRKAGFCEHIASSFVILMRALDIPARIVTGYQGGELNSVDGFWVVRQSDAHAWAEVWQAGRGWVRVDPTSAVSPGRTGAFQRLAPPRGVVAQAFGNFSPDLAARLRATWEAVNNGWSQWVLNYTQGSQLKLLKDIGFTSPGREDLTTLLIGALVLASIAGAGWAWWDRSQHDPWLRLLGQVRKRLAQAGIASTPATAPRELARQVLQKYGRQGQALHDWLVQLDIQRYADPATLPRLLGPLRRQLSRLRWPA
ncbi:MAG: transglutaminase domain protein [Polaromonas sp.]|nr:transglutaminase domain protein [Polaromonas sp.]